MKISICNDFFNNWSEDEIFRFISEIGFDGIEIAPFFYADNVNDISVDVRDNIKKKASQFGLEIVGLHWVLLGPKGLHLTHPNQKIRNITRDYLLSLIKFCADIGGKVIIFGSPKQRNLTPEVNKGEGFDYAADVFSQCMNYAADRDVTICIEPLGKMETNFINNISEAIKLVKRVNHKYFKTMIDIKAAITEDIPIQTVITKTAKYIHHVHLNDIDGIAPGYGPTQFKPIIKTLEDIGYNKYISLEIFKTQESIQNTAIRSLKYIKDNFTNKNKKL